MRLRRTFKLGRKFKGKRQFDLSRFKTPGELRLRFYENPSNLPPWYTMNVIMLAIVMDTSRLISSHLMLRVSFHVAQTVTKHGR
jgi:hypothetical protein